MNAIQLFLAASLVTTIGVSSQQVAKSDEAESNLNPNLETIIAEGGEGAEDGGELSPGEQANADFVDQISGSELLTELQQGGYTIYFRHAQTEKDYADQVTADVNNCSTQRVLSEVGVEQSITIGNAFADAEIPIGKITTSDYCRAWGTAALAFGNYEKDSALNFLPFEDYTPEQVEQMKTNVMPLLTEVPDSGTNNIIVGHDDIFESGTGIYPDPQGIAYVLKPDGNGSFEIVANILPEEWEAL